MKKTIELLKKEGIIDKLQRNFNKCKPPKGTQEETILDVVEHVISFELDKSKGFEDAFFEAVFADAIQHIRNELNIEFTEENEALTSILPKPLVEMFEKLGANVKVHVVCLDGEKKGQGEK